MIYQYRVIRVFAIVLKLLLFFRVFLLLNLYDLKLLTKNIEIVCSKDTPTMLFYFTALFSLCLTEIVIICKSSMVLWLLGSC